MAFAFNFPVCRNDIPNTNTFYIIFIIGLQFFSIICKFEFNAMKTLLLSWTQQFKVATQFFFQASCHT